MMTTTYGGMEYPSRKDTGAWARFGFSSAPLTELSPVSVAEASWTFDLAGGPSEVEAQRLAAEHLDDLRRELSDAAHETLGEGFSVQNVTVRAGSIEVGATIIAVAKVVWKVATNYRQVKEDVRQAASEIRGVYEAFRDRVEKYVAFVRGVIWAWLRRLGIKARRGQAHVAAPVPS